MQRRSTDEAFWVGLISEIKNDLPFRDELGGLTKLNVGCSYQFQASVVLVVPLYQGKISWQKGAHVWIEPKRSGNWDDTSWS
jgi:hypothetical protein